MEFFCEEEESLDSVSKREFVTNLETYYQSIQKYKEEHSDNLSEYWKPEYDEIEKEFLNLLSLIEFNWANAKEKSEQLECFKFENFAQYVFNTNTNKSLKIKSTIAKSKTIRRKRNNKCPKCDIICTVTNDMTILKCPKCGFEIMKDKVGIPDNVINGEKHIRKHLDKIIGLSKLPVSIRKLLPYLTLWITNWKYVYRWLTYSNKLSDFQYKIYSRTSEYITDFDTILERDENHIIDFATYEIFTEEFFKMTEATNKINKKTCNIDKDDNYVIEIITEYSKTLKRKMKSFYDFPREDYQFEYKGVKYALGLYFLKLSLIANYDEHHIKNRIIDILVDNSVYVENEQSIVEELEKHEEDIEEKQKEKKTTRKRSKKAKKDIDIDSLEADNDEEIKNMIDKISDNKDNKKKTKQVIKQIYTYRNPHDVLIFPGLMFNFSDLFTLSQNPPKSFIYSENYNKVMNEIFHSKFTLMSSSDIERIVDILLKYNAFYKNNIESKGKKRNTKTNSPLFVCVFKNIITTFKYFHKYLPILKQLPHRITESSTKKEIDNLWTDFIMLPENKELFDYTEIKEEEIEEKKDEEINEEDDEQIEEDKNEIEKDNDDSIFDSIF